jgi:hypothetical protein
MLVKELIVMQALAAWRSGYSIRLRNRRHGLNPARVYFFRGNMAMLLYIIDLIFIVCVLKKRTRDIGPKIFFKLIFFGLKCCHDLNSSACYQATRFE